MSTTTEMRKGFGARPYLMPRLWIWKDPKRNQTPGIGLFRGIELKAHLTPTEARTLADTLHDMADTLESENKGTSL